MFIYIVVLHNSPRHESIVQIYHNCSITLIYIHKKQISSHTILYFAKLGIGLPGPYTICNDFPLKQAGLRHLLILHGGLGLLFHLIRTAMRVCVKDDRMRDKSTKNLPQMTPCPKSHQTYHNRLLLARYK